MPAKSKAQQRLMAQAYALKKGELELKDINPEYRDKIKDLADSMSDKDLKDYAETDTKDLPDNVEEDLIPGGLADDKTLDDIAKKHNVSIQDIQIQFEMGVEVEMEHTNDKSLAKEIAMDHLMEDPQYYTKLKQVEEKVELVNLLEWDEF